ncbi:hypothetical protein G6L37_06205 [Agrobacterium rubi]|nr:hypothetical protein [Agrobacterium rubi]NTF24954.1 hypothetical protein [Agrobacterium rubi]
MMNDKQLAAEVESLAIRLERMRDALAEVGRLLDGHDQIGEAILLVKSALDADTSAALSGLDHNGLRLRIGGIHLQISEEHAGKGPVPIIVKHAGDQPPNLWSTTDGSAVYRDREWAERADYMKTEEYALKRDRLCAARRLVRATVEEGYDGWVTTDGNEDEYAASTDELLERLRDRMWGDVPEDEIPSHLPAWVHCCTEQDFDFDIEDAISSYLDDNHHEDAIDWIKDWDGLTSFWADWRAKQKDLRSNLIDYTRIVVIDRPRYEAELAAAKAYLETAE